MIRQRQVAVAVHPDVVAVAALQPVARTARVLAGGTIADDDPLGRFGAPFLFELASSAASAVSSSSSAEADQIRRRAT